MYIWDLAMCTDTSKLITIAPIANSVLQIPVTDYNSQKESAWICKICFLYYSVCLESADSKCW